MYLKTGITKKPIKKNANKTNVVYKNSSIYNNLIN